MCLMILLFLFSRTTGFGGWEITPWCRGTPCSSVFSGEVCHPRSTQSTRTATASSSSSKVSPRASPLPLIFHRHTQIYIHPTQILCRASRLLLAHRVVRVIETETCSVCTCLVSILHVFSMCPLSQTNTGFYLCSLLHVIVPAARTPLILTVCVCEFCVNLWKIKAMFCSLSWKIHCNPQALTFNNVGVKFSGGGSNMF